MQISLYAKLFTCRTDVMLLHLTVKVVMCKSIKNYVYLLLCKS